MENNNIPSDKGVEKRIQVPQGLQAKLPVKEVQEDTGLQIRSTIENCTKELQEVSANMSGIKDQEAWKRLWNASSNFENLAEHVDKVTGVQQKSLDLIVMLMGASHKLKDQYEVIIDSIEDLSEINEGNPAVLDYLVKVKNTVKDIKERDELLESLLTFSNDLRDSVEEVSELSVDMHQELFQLKEKQKKFAGDVAETLSDAADKTEALQKEQLLLLEKILAVQTDNEQLQNAQNALKEENEQLKGRLTFVFVLLAALIIGVVILGIQGVHVR